MQNNDTLTSYFLRVIPTLTHYSDIVSDIPSGSIYGILYVFRHFFWHSIWHLFWHILTFFLAFYLASILTYFLAFYLASIPKFYLAFYLPFCLAFYLVSILIFSLTWALPDLNRKRQITHWDLEPKMCITNHYYTLYVRDEHIGIATSFPFLSLSADATSKAQGDGTHSPLQLRLRWVKSASRQVSDPEISFERKTWWQGLCAWRCDFANAKNTTSMAQPRILLHQAWMTSCTFGPGTSSDIAATSGWLGATPRRKLHSAVGHVTVEADEAWNTSSDGKRSRMEYDMGAHGTAVYYV